MTSLLNEQSQLTSWSHQLNEDNNKNKVDEEILGNNAATPVRKRTRATADQLSVLEDTFAVNVSPNSKLRKQLAEQLQMSERSIQIWFQNRRAKVKHMQKRAQIQMHQASIRAQLYQYQQQHQQQQPYPYYYNRITVPGRAQSVDAVQNHHFNSSGLVQQELFTPPSSVPPLSYSATPPPMSYPQFFNQQTQNHHTSFGLASFVPPDALHLSRQSMPPQVYPLDTVDTTISGLEFPEYVHGQISPSSSPLQQQSTTSSSVVHTLVPVPDAGPTAVLATSIASPHHHSSQSPSASYSQVSPSTTPGAPTINPSSLLIHTEKNETQKAKEEEQPNISDANKEDTETNGKQTDNKEDEPKDLYLSATTLTIGTWHRLKMQETDLVCVYRPDTRIFAWHIVDGGCHFKMEVPQHAVSSIDFVLDNHEALADVHFDISEPPLFYMESTTSTINTAASTDKKTKRRSSETELNASPIWVQCSDFTEGKQASRFFRHTLKGVAHHMKQELIALTSNHEETRRLVHFIDARHSFNAMPMYQPLVESQQLPYLSSQPFLQPHLPADNRVLIQAAGFTNPASVYWSNQSMSEPIAPELYIN